MPMCVTTRLGHAILQGCKMTGEIGPRIPLLAAIFRRLWEGEPAVHHHFNSGGPLTSMPLTDPSDGELALWEVGSQVSS